ncbi:MAG: radical SAM family heme chaperone HemW [Candidatus Gracilibacteria bacterium]|nr:radical SAM family heme chaperone HemW [Candidatus Gracilibacteria bacterium]
MFAYVHIPFCSRKCRYCKFASIPAGKGEDIEKYLDHLKQEIIGFSSGKSFNSIYFGGGTPSILSIKQIDSIINAFKNQGKISADAELTLEMNPEDISIDYINGLKEIGINRLSVGIQSLNERTLSEIGRCDIQTVLKGLDILNLGIIENVGLDFIIGLPYEKKGDKMKDISNILYKYGFVRHISVYMLEEGIYPKNWGIISLNKDEYIDEYKDISEILEKNDFARYEISNFSKTGFECQHNRSYWNHSDYRGFGLSAASFVDGKRFANSSDFNDYYGGILEYEEKLNETGLAIEKIMFDLRTIGVRKELLNAKVEEFISDGLLEEETGLVRPTLDGIGILDYMLSELI